MNKTVIECNGIAAGYVKGLNILQGVDLIVNEKEIVSIIGPNGAGKSTLLKAIMGIIFQVVVFLLMVWKKQILLLIKLSMKELVTSHKLKMYFHH